MIYLEEEAEADPLVVSDISPLLWVYCLVDAGVSNINTCTAQSPSQSSSKYHSDTTHLSSSKMR